MHGAVEHSLVLSEDIWLPECRWLLTSLDRRSKNVRVPIVIAELEGERGIIALSTNPRKVRYLALAVFAFGRQARSGQLQFWSVF
jgi:hypothetical protein